MNVRLYIIFVLVNIAGFFLMQKAIACSPAPGAMPSSIAQKVNAAAYVFTGVVKEVNPPVAVVDVEQYFKGSGLSRVTIVHFNENSCSDFMAVGQQAVFFAEGNMGATLSAVYDGAFGSSRQINPETYAEITAAIECMAFYEDGRLVLPCVTVQGSGRVYQAYLEEDSSAKRTHFSVTLVQPSSGVLPKATIKEIDIQILESFPVQVHVIAKGLFNNGCGRVGKIYTNLIENEFFITVTQNNITGVACTQAIVAFEEIIPLPVTGLKAGNYTVNVNSISDVFELP